MNFNLLFSAVSALSFIIEFPKTTEERQDYFIFEGINQAAHLFRENETLILHLSFNAEYTTFKAGIEEETFEFSWSGFEVDGKKWFYKHHMEK